MQSVSIGMFPKVNRILVIRSAHNDGTARAQQSKVRTF